MIALLGAGAAVLAAVLIGFAWRGGEGALKPGSGERIRPDEVAVPDGAFGARATFLLFTSQQDEIGAGLLAVLDELAAGTPGVLVASVDLTTRGDLAGRYAVTRTPTTFVLDGAWRLRGRVKGAATREVLLTALARAQAADPQR